MLYHVSYLLYNTRLRWIGDNSYLEYYLHYIGFRFGFRYVFLITKTTSTGTRVVFCVRFRNKRFFCPMIWESIHGNDGDPA